MAINDLAKEYSPPSPWFRRLIKRGHRMGLGDPADSITVAHERAGTFETPEYLATNPVPYNRLYVSIMKRFPSLETTELRYYDSSLSRNKEELLSRDDLRKDVRRYLENYI